MNAFQAEVPDRGRLTTERSHPLSAELDQLDAQAAVDLFARADQAARLGFLAWALGLDRGAKDAACAALDGLNSGQRHSVAAETFVGFVRTVATTDAARPLRRGGASARRKTFH